jgi:hypothetical protein
MLVPVEGLEFLNSPGSGTFLPSRRRASVAACSTWRRAVQSAYPPIACGRPTGGQDRSSGPHREDGDVRFDPSPKQSTIRLKANVSPTSKPGGFSDDGRINAVPSELRLGTAGWNVPATCSERIGVEGSHTQMRLTPSRSTARSIARIATALTSAGHGLRRAASAPRSRCRRKSRTPRTSTLRYSTVSQER